MNSFDNDFDADEDLEDGGDDTVEARIWQLLLLINPGDDELAMQQFAEYRDAAGEDEAEPVEVVSRVIDWRSGFHVGAGDTRALVQAIDELSSRWNITIDWDGDPDDDDFHADMDAATLFATAYDRLAEHGYTLWAWETGDEGHAGWMTLTRDNEPMREVATVLGINMRLGSDVS